MYSVEPKLGVACHLDDDSLRDCSKGAPHFYNMEPYCALHHAHCLPIVAKHTPHKLHAPNTQAFPQSLQVCIKIYGTLMMFHCS